MEKGFEELIKQIKDETISEGEKYIPIGRLSSLTKVSVRRIRHYCDVGLLKPDFVDAISGYRYFTHSQISNVLLIIELRGFGFSLGQIDKMFDAMKAQEGMTLFDEQLSSLEEEIAGLTKKKDRLTSLRSYIDWSSSLNRKNETIRIKVVTMEERHFGIYSVEETMMNGLAFKEAFETMSRTIESIDDSHLKNYGAFYETTVEERMNKLNMRYAVEIPKNTYQHLHNHLEKNDKQVEGINALYHMSAGDYISLVYKGDYDSFYKEAYPALSAYLNEKQFQKDGPYLELYHLTRPFEAFGMLTEIQVKINSLTLT